MSRYSSLSIATRCPAAAVPAFGREPTLAHAQRVDGDPRTVAPGGGTGT